jgi:membrane associated rhomboid family serine protease
MSKYKSPSSFRMPVYQNNAVIQIILASGVGYIALLFTAVCFQAFAHYRFPDAINLISPYVALPAAASFKSGFWTLLTYGWSHYGFWDWASNMIWLYAFGSIVQTLVGYKQIIPMFIYGTLVGGVFYLLAQLIPGEMVPSGKYVLGAQAGITAFAVAALTLSPKYRLYMSDTFSIPLPLLAAVFGVLMIVRTNLQIPYLAMIGGGALLGFAYIKLLRSGFQPGVWMYTLYEKLNDMFTPRPDAFGKDRQRREDVWKAKHAKRTSGDQQRIDELLDKINRNGYESLTKEEKEALMRASQQKE